MAHWYGRPLQVAITSHLFLEHLPSLQDLFPHLSMVLENIWLAWYIWNNADAVAKARIVLIVVFVQEGHCWSIHVASGCASSYTQLALCIQEHSNEVQFCEVLNIKVADWLSLQSLSIIHLPFPPKNLFHMVVQMLCCKEPGACWKCVLLDKCLPAIVVLQISMLSGKIVCWFSCVLWMVRPLQPYFNQYSATTAAYTHSVTFKPLASACT